MLLASTIRLLALVIGGALSVFVAVLFGTKRRPALCDRTALAASLALGGWQIVTAASIFHVAVAGRTSPTLLAVLDQAAMAALALLPTLVLHLAALWSGARPRAFLLGYAAVPLAWGALESGRPDFYGVWLILALSISAALCARAARRAPGALTLRRFFAAFAGSLLAVAAAAALAGPAPAAPAAVSLAPPLILTWWIYRYNVFGLLIRPRLVFALKMGIVFALYLLIVRGLASLVQDEFEVFGPLVELALIFAAALVWLPLYGWMSRFLSKRTAVYVAFSKRLIEEAARILDLHARVQFLADEVGRTFGLNRALLVTGGDSPLVGRYGSPGGGEADSRDFQQKLFRLARTYRADLVSSTGNEDPEVGRIIAAASFNYLVPLWYEDRLNGLLLLDTSPRPFLGEDEPILLGLSGQLSHSLETGRVIEEKISLERKLAHQEQLATLGRAAAMIAHEVRNPLSSIKTLTQLMREDPAVESRHSRDLAFVLGEVDRLNRTAQQLLSFSRPISASEEEVNLSELLELTAEVLAREYAARDTRIEQRIEPRLRLPKASAEALQQVVLNVVLNAIQASPACSAVKLEASNTGAGSIAITVTDQGPGIPPEIRERMFEPFFTTRHKGTGLGLAIVRKHVEQMRGTIEVESPITDNGGARVAITLPCE